MKWWPFGKKKKDAQARSYQAAMFDRLVADWVSSGASADAEIKASLTAMRNRSRQLARDDDYYSNILRLFEVNVVGKGMEFQCQIRNQRGGDLNTAANDKIETEWYRWAKASSCDAAGKLTFAEIQKIGVRATVQDGDIFIRKIKQAFGKSKVQASLELIEADLCDENYNEILPNGNIVKMGVEFSANGWGRPLAYHFFTRHPGENGPYAYAGDRNRIRIPAEEIIHLFDPKRAKQTRGVPRLASSMMPLHHIKGYREAEVIAARASSALMGFIETSDELQGDDVQDGQRVTEFEPGVFKQMRPGEKVNVPQINRPGNQFQPFMEVLLRGVSAGAGISYECTSKDYSKSTYSSARQALLEDRDNYRVMQTWLIEKLNQPVFEFWLEQAVMSRVISLPRYFQEPELYHESIRWMPRGWNWIDPSKEVKANSDAVRAGFLTQSDVVAQMGGDFEELVLARDREVKLAKKFDLKFDSDPASDAGNNVEPITENNDNEEPVMPEGNEDKNAFLLSEKTH